MEPSGSTSVDHTATSASTSSTTVFSTVQMRINVKSRSSSNSITVIQIGIQSLTLGYYTSDVIKILLIQLLYCQFSYCMFNHIAVLPNDLLYSKWFTLFSKAAKIYIFYFLIWKRVFSIFFALFRNDGNDQIKKNDEGKKENHWIQYQEPLESS